MIPHIHGSEDSIVKNPIRPSLFYRHHVIPIKITTHDCADTNASITKFT